MPARQPAAGARLVPGPATIPLMIAGVSWEWWASFHAVVAALLVADAWVSGRRGQRQERQFSWRFLALLVLAAAGLAGWIAWSQGPRPALEFVAGYTVEISLSIDNLLVFTMLFAGFGIGPARQHKALLWGICGAVVLRAVFIGSGIALLRHFDWLTWVLGAFLLYAAWRLLFGSPREVIPGWIRRFQPARGSLLPVILAVEFTDLLFATDSIPAVLSVTRNPFIAYTSNIAAVLGLRSLYFGMTAALKPLRRLHYGLGALMAFVGLKMLAAKWLEVPIGISLAVMASILAATALASLRKQGLGIKD